MYEDLESTESLDGDEFPLELGMQELELMNTPNVWHNGIYTVGTVNGMGATPAWMAMAAT